MTRRPPKPLTKDDSHRCARVRCSLCSPSTISSPRAPFMWILGRHSDLHLLGSSTEGLRRCTCHLNQLTLDCPERWRPRTYLRLSQCSDPLDPQQRLGITALSWAVSNKTSQLLGASGGTSRLLWFYETLKMISTLIVNKNNRSCALQ